MNIQIKCAFFMNAHLGFLENKSYLINIVYIHMISCFKPCNGDTKAEYLIFNSKFFELLAI